MLNELNPNETPERRGHFPGIGVPEVAFAAGFVAAVAGLALVSVALALIAAGTLAMVIGWRLA